MATVLDRVVQSCATGQGAWLVVPTQADAVRARRELAGRAPLLLRAQVGTFRHLAAAAAGCEEARLADPTVETLVVGRLVREVKALRDVVQYPGHIATVRMRLAELRTARAAGAESERELLLTLPAAEREAWRQLCERVDAELQTRGLTTAECLEQRASELLEGDGEWRRGPVLAYGFDDFSASQLRLLLALARRTEVVVSMPFVPGRVVFERRQQLVDRMRAAGARLVEQGEAQFDSPTLTALEASFAEPTAPPISASATQDEVTFVECCGSLQEAEEVVREVGALLRRGVAPERIAVLSSAVGAHQPLLEPLFRRAGIAATFERARTIEETPAGRAVLDALRAVSEDDPIRYAAFAASRISPTDDAHRRAFDEAVLPRLARGSQTSRRHWWTDAAADPVRALIGVGDAAIEAVRDLLCQLIPRGEGDVRVLAAFASQLDLLEQMLGPDERPTLAELVVSLAAIPIPAPTDRPEGAVVVAPTTRVRTDRFDAVVMFGLHAGGFGGGDDEEAPLLARELAYAAFTRARRSVRFVRQAAGSDGRLRAPHVVWRELRRLLPDAPLRVRRLQDVVCAPETVVLHSELGMSVALAHAEGRAIDDDSIRELVPAPRAVRDGSVGAPWIEELAATTAISVSELEDYAGCPSRWFIRRKLLRSEPAETSSRQVVGMLVHEALADLLPKLAAGSGIEDQLVTRALERAQGQVPEGAIVAAIDVAIARNVVERTLADERIYGEAVLTELGFGGSRDPLPAVVVDGVAIRGRIDRMDVAADGAVVVHDYKLSRAAVAGAKLVEAGRLQLPLYWAAVRGSAHHHPVAALYRPLEGDRPRGLIDAELGPAVVGQVRTDRFEAERINELIDEAMAETRRVLGDLRSGSVGPAPRGDACPDWCDLDDVCRVSG